MVSHSLAIELNKNLSQGYFNLVVIVIGFKNIKHIVREQDQGNEQSIFF